MRPPRNCRIAKLPEVGSNAAGTGGAPMGEKLTVLLAGMKAGDRAARDALFAVAYEDLRRLAHARLRGGGRNTMLDTTALVNESYFRWVNLGQLRLEDRKAFFAYASRVMQSVIVDSARARLAEKRGGSCQKMSLYTGIEHEFGQDEASILKVHDALEELEKVEERVAQMVRMRFFGGYSVKEIAETLEVDERTVQRDWEKAKLLLRAILKLM
jgi:RNA polymerase sigma factor (TIGR02999 family)